MGKGKTGTSTLAMASVLTVGPAASYLLLEGSMKLAAMGKLFRISGDSGVTKTSCRLTLRLLSKDKELRGVFIVLSQELTF